MNALPVRLDFVARRAHFSLKGLILLVLGLALCSGTILEFRRLNQQRDGLELKIAAELKRSQRNPLDEARVAAVSADVSRVATQLATPWTGLLNELELASRDDAQHIALLSIEPDHEKHRIHITAESRDLPMALAYLQRLQASSVLRYPMLDSHEVRADQPEHPVRFALSAEWWPAP